MDLDSTHHRRRPLRHSRAQDDCARARRSALRAHSKRRRTDRRISDAVKERALEQADRIDRMAAEGKPLPPLAGVPVGIKDVMSTRGVRTTAGSKILENYIPPYDCTAVARMEAAGAVVLGKMNCDEFAMGSSNENSAFHPVRNPRDLSRVPGGSSGGSAAAVAADMAVVALGSDTGGSIRQPASFCGVVGLMPTYGRVSRYGLIAFASSLDHIGPLTKTVKDAAIVLHTIAGRDPMDSTSADVPVPDYVAELEKPVRGLKLGVAKEYFGDGLDDEVRQAVESAIDKLKSLGCEIVPVSLPHTPYAIPTYYLIATAEASSNLARYDGVRYSYRARGSEVAFGDVSPQPRRRFRRRSEAPHHARHLRAERRILRCVLPESAKSAHAADARFRGGVSQSGCNRDADQSDRGFRLGEKSNDPLAMYLADIYTVTADLAGIPGISIPCGETQEKLPIGLQILGKHFDEATILRVAHAYEQAA